MAGKIGDSEEQRQIDRIMAVAFRQARDSGATFINRKWIAEKLGRSKDWVTDIWNKQPQECFTQFGEGRPQQLSQESRNIFDVAPQNPRFFRPFLIEIQLLIGHSTRLL